MKGGKKNWSGKWRQKKIKWEGINRRGPGEAAAMRGGEGRGEEKGKAGGAGAAFTRKEGKSSHSQL